MTDDINYSRDSFAIKIQITGIKTSDYEQLEKIAEVMEMVVRGICQECDIHAITRYHTCFNEVFKEESE